MPSIRILKVLLVPVVLAALAGAAAPGIPTFQAGESVTAEGRHDDMVFAAGEDVRITAKTPDDIFAAGADIIIDGAEADHLILAGADLSFAGVVVEDIIAAGAELLLTDGQVADDVILAGAEVTVRPGFSVGGSMIVSSADVILEGPVAGDVRAAGQSIRIDGDIGGGVDVRAETLIIGAGSRIMGDLRHRADDVTIEDGADIRGETIALDPGERPHLKPAMMGVVGALAAFAVLFTLGLLLLVLISVMAFPGLMNNARTMLGRAPLTSLGIGFLLTIVAPALVATLFASVVGIPLGLLVMVLYAALMPLALGASLYWAGVRLGALFRKGTDTETPGLAGRAGWTLLASVLFFLLALLPIVGGLIWIAAFVIGLGAVGTQAFRALAQAQPLPRGA